MSKYILDSQIDITSHTSTSPYTCPANGYLVLSVSGAVGDYIRAVASSGSGFINISAYKSISDNHGYNALFLKKDMKCYVQSAMGTSSSAVFIPFR